MADSQAGTFRPVLTEIELWRRKWKSRHNPPPAVVFHYTDAAGLQGIIKGGALWASHVYYVNDAQEFSYARSFILSRFETRIQESDPNVAEKIRRICEAYRGHSFLFASVADVYIVCFCEKGDLLSQWRAYAAHGQGFALGFDPRQLMEAVHNDVELASHSKLFRVLYDATEQQDWVDSAIDQLLAALEAHVEDKVLDQVPLVFSEMAFSFKHPAFSEEREWRLACAARPELGRMIDVRISNGRLLPYASIPICRPCAAPSYVELIHGPTTDAQNTRKALSLLLGKAHPAHWDAIAITGSDAPLRPR
jgi:hypothetical protein